MTTDADHPAPPPCVVCIPARNEAERLPRLLASLAAQNGVSARAPLRVGGEKDAVRLTVGLQPVGAGIKRHAPGRADMGVRTDEVDRD
ncbi:hypothetical protein OMR07_29415, partial [Methylobacterium organophilum]|nr:hypothetical protein [Methylobacterium organophilum]